MITKHVALIIPYFGGEFPNYFQLFLNSCGKNPDFTWMIFTDNKTEYWYPDNVKKISMSFGEMVSRVRSKFDFDICLNKPYKLCDYKCAYGYIFEDYLEGYDFWGHSDCDLIYGRLSNFITDDILDNYDKILTLGHLTLYKNISRISKMFMSKLDGEEYYKKVFTSDEIFNFDEDWNERVNINDIFRQYGERIFYNENNQCHIADLYTKSSDFRVVLPAHEKEKNSKEKRRKNSLFVYDKGMLMRYDKKGAELENQEYLYIHFHKRPMNILINFDDEIYSIIPNSFEKIDMGKLEKDYECIKKKNMNLQYFRIRLENFRVKIRRRLSR